MRGGIRTAAAPRWSTGYSFNEAPANCGGESQSCRTSQGLRGACFNEAPANCGGEYLPRRQSSCHVPPASMRPPRIAGGNSGRQRSANPARPRFNEAPANCGGESPYVHGGNRHVHASMRPPRIAGGNDVSVIASAYLDLASMRPPRIAGGNESGHRRARHLAVSASMRPPRIAGGNLLGMPTPGRQHAASMRPPRIAGGNPMGERAAEGAGSRFNEAPANCGGE